MARNDLTSQYLVLTRSTAHLTCRVSASERWSPWSTPGGRLTEKGSTLSEYPLVSLYPTEFATTSSLCSCALQFCSACPKLGKSIFPFTVSEVRRWFNNRGVLDNKQLIVCLRRLGFQWVVRLRFVIRCLAEEPKTFVHFSRIRHAA